MNIGINLQTLMFKSLFSYSSSTSIRLVWRKLCNSCILYQIFNSIIIRWINCFLLINKMKLIRLEKCNHASTNKILFCFPIQLFFKLHTHKLSRNKILDSEFFFFNLAIKNYNIYQSLEFHSILENNTFSSSMIFILFDNSINSKIKCVLLIQNILLYGIFCIVSNWEYFFHLIIYLFYDLL